VNNNIKIENVKARSIFDSRGTRTIEVDVFTNHHFGTAQSPSGASTGLNEVISYPRGGIEEAIKLVNEKIAPILKGIDVEKQAEVDAILHQIDGTNNFEHLGGNTSIAISIAVCKAAASSRNKLMFEQLSGNFELTLPVPLGNVLGGGKHAGTKAPDIQEFLVLPVNAQSFSEAAWANINVHKRIRKILESVDSTFTAGKSDEGAWAPNLTNEKALDVVSKASEEISNELGVIIRVGLDIASSSLWDMKKNSYLYLRDGKTRSPEEQIDYVVDLIKTHKLIYVEDPLHEEDFQGFAELTKKTNSCFICGDDLFTTNAERLRKGAKIKAGNAIIIKPNQVGTLTETFETVKLAKSVGYAPIVSHRSGEACDTYLSHLAVGFNCPIIKAGVVGGERIAKINELLRIEEFLGKKVKIAKVNN